MWVRAGNRPALLAVAGLAAAAACVVTSTTAVSSANETSAAFACRVTYSANDWGSGFGLTVGIGNLGSSAVDGWTLTYSYGAYPAILWLLARLKPQPERDRAPSELPNVTVVLPAHNEERRDIVVRLFTYGTQP